MQDLHDFELVLISRNPILVIESLEEPRVVQLLTRLAMRLNHPMFQWSVSEGLKRLGLDFDAQKHNAEPDDVLKHIKAVSQPGFYLLLDFHPYLQDPLHIRLIKEIAQGYETVPRTLIFLSYDFPTPPEIRHLTVRFSLQLPDRAGIKRLINEEAERWQGRSRRPVSADSRAVEQLADNLTGVTATDARRLIRSAIEDDGAIRQEDLPRIMRAKYELINQDGIISFEYDTAKFSDVAGLRQLKKWLKHRRKAFSGGIASLDRPKGIMLLGVQGGGKSLAAKAVAGSFGVPLLRLDFATLYNKFIGETEKNLQRALDLAETMAPCVLWMDEIEKGISLDSNDDGVSRRILGTLLTWMAEHKASIFIIATSNNIEQLPPELVRKGRLDEIFFVDLPDRQSRLEIFKIHLRVRNLAPSGFDLESLSHTSEGFTGAEIEQSIVSALYAAQAQDETLNTGHLQDELERTSPLSVVMGEKIAYLRNWAADRAVPAN
ncbi:MAG: AAA family ATPase [Gammaproteobacteria bacterium]|nr:AAA family ATPase [Gammaproteobacteria bacterium]